LYGKGFDVRFLEDLGRQSAAVGRRAAEASGLLDGRHLEAVIGGVDGGLFACRAGADDDEVVRLHFPLLHSVFSVPR
jgi:hypothetical protein